MTSRADLREITAQSQPWPGSEGALDPQPDHGADWTPRQRLTGRRALVTGGDSGIGRAVAHLFALEGADVVLTHLPEERGDAEQTASLVRAAGRECLLLEADLTRHRQNVAAVEAAVAGLSGLDVLVCNAGFQMSHESLADFPPEQVERVFATNVFSTFWLVQAATTHLAPGSAVVVTTSIQAYSPSDHLVDYAASKAALNNLVVALAGELGPRGVRVNAVAPGPIWTPLIPATMPPDRVAGFGTDTPLGRAGHPAEVAAAYVFLASEEASYVSGTVLGVTGGKPVF